MATAAVAQYFKGTGAMNVTVRPDDGRAFRLVYVRAHFRGSLPGASTDLVLQLDSAAGEEHDAELYRVLNAGLGADVHLILTDTERAEPSPWAFQPGDGLRLFWPRPVGADWSWGLEVGIELLVG